GGQSAERVRRGEALRPGGPEHETGHDRLAEVSGHEGVVGRPRRQRIRRTEVHRADVAGGNVPERVEGGDGGRGGRAGDESRSGPAFVVARFATASRASIVAEPTPPAVTGDGNPDTFSEAAAPAAIEMPLCVPVIVFVTVSVAVIDCVPAVFSVTVKLWMPL